MKESLRSRLKRYMYRRHSEWVCGGFLERLVAQETTYKPSNTGRRLRELVEDGELMVEYRNGIAWYKAKEGVAPPKHEIVIPGVGHLPSYESLVAAGKI